MNDFSDIYKKSIFDKIIYLFDNFEFMVGYITLNFKDLLLRYFSKIELNIISITMDNENKKDIKIRGRNIIYKIFNLIDYKKIYDYLYYWKISYSIGENINNFLDGFIGRLRERRSKLIKMILDKNNMFPEIIKIIESY